MRHIKQHGQNSYSLTSKGESRLRTIVIDEIEIKTQRNWDGKWRLVMYDLPIRFRKAREAFRWTLKDFGFFQFQKSAWIYPYPCEEEIGFLTDFFEINQNIKIATADKIFEDKELKEYFKLR